MIGQNSARLVRPDPDVSEFRFLETGEGDHAKPGRMTVVPGELISAPADDWERGSAVQIALSRVFPVPAGDVPIEDILEFKEKRRDELLLFRLRLGEMYQTVLASADSARALGDAIDTLVMARDELCRVMDETRLQRFWRTVKAEAGLTGVASGAVISMLVGGGLITGFTHIGVPTEVAVPAGAVTPLLLLGLERSVFRTAIVPEKLEPWAYMYYVEKELSG